MVLEFETGPTGFLSSSAAQETKNKVSSPEMVSSFIASTEYSFWRLASQHTELVRCWLLENDCIATLNPHTWRKALQLDISNCLRRLDG